MSDTEEDENVFVVERILKHKRFEECVDRCLRGKIIFEPSSLQMGADEHSEYAYLVHWLGYTKFDRTWEPECNLESLSLLRRYKRKHLLPNAFGERSNIFVKSYPEGTYEAMAVVNDRLKHKVARRKELYLEERQKIAIESEDSQREEIENSGRSEGMRTPTPTPSVELPISRQGSYIEEDGLENDENLSPRFNMEEIRNSLEINGFDSDENSRKRRISEESEPTPPPSSPDVKAKYNGDMSIRSGLQAVGIVAARRWTSQENLSEFFTEKAEFELYNLRYFKVDSLAQDDEVPLEKSIPGDDDDDSFDMEEKAEKAGRERVAKYNADRVKCDFRGMQNVDPDIAVKVNELIENLVSSFTNDDYEKFEEVFESVPTDEDGCFKPAIIQSIVRRCSTYTNQRERNLFKKRYMSFSASNEQVFFETNEDIVLSETMFSLQCSENHTKCRWIDLFLKLLPPKMRFQEHYDILPKINDHDGPFRSELFLYCMRYGAECQKLKFFKYHCPLSDEVEELYDFTIDHVICIVLQGYNFQKNQFYFKYGFDLNAFATNKDNGEVLCLDEYVGQCEELLSLPGTPENKAYFPSLARMIKNSSTRLQNEIITVLKTDMINKFPASDNIKLKNVITHAHIMKCSPVSNAENDNGFNGESLVQCCLFSYMGWRHFEKYSENDNRIGTEVFQKEYKKIREVITQKKGRFFVGVYRINLIVYDLPTETEFLIPDFKVVRSDEGMQIESITILRQGRMSEDEADLGMTEMKEFSTPGFKVFMFPERFIEDLVVPGMAHFLLKGHFDEPMNFAVQLYYMA